MSSLILNTCTGVNQPLQKSVDHDNLELNIFQYTDYFSQDLEKDIDPVNNFFHNTNCNCFYYTNDQFNSTVKIEKQLSIIHFNCLYANFHNIKYYLNQFKQPFNIIALTETWINSEKGL